MGELKIKSEIKKAMIFHLLLIICGSVLTFLIWWGIGFGVGFILESGLNADVNRAVFNNVGIIIGLVHGGFILILGIIQNLIIRKSKRW